MKLQVLSRSVAHGLRVSLGIEAAGTARFCEMFDKFFDCLNVSNMVEGKHKRNVFKDPYRSTKDFRLKVFFPIFVVLHVYAFAVAKR